MVAKSHPGEGKEEDKSSTSGCHSISLGWNILRFLISDSKETAHILIPLHSHWQIWDCTQYEQIPTGTLISGDRMGIFNTESDKNKGNNWWSVHPLTELSTPLLVYDKAMAELVLVQHEAFQRQLPMQAFPRKPKHNEDLIFMHCLCPQALKKMVFSLFCRNKSVAKVSLALTADRVREVSPNPAQGMGR